MQTDLIDYIDGHRDGATYSPTFDYDRLNRQARDVFDVMRDGMWRSLRDIASLTDHPEASISARLRDFRKPKFGGLTVQRRRLDGGLFQYRIGDENDT